MKALVYLDGIRAKPVGFWGKIKLRSSIKDFQRCLLMMPTHWQAMVFLGKAYQRMGSYAEALSMFERAMEIENMNSAIPREASLTAALLRNIDKAIRYSAIANERKPDDHTLLSNYALNLLLGKKDEEAMVIIGRALEIAPEDQINQRISLMIDEVVSGKCKRPNPEEVIG
jgi:tetratricopeptide (TPR) repeat protein